MKCDYPSLKLEGWLANTEKELQAKTLKNKPGLLTQETKIASDHELSAKFLGRFGLKSAQDVMVFLNSPAGATVKEMVAAQWSEQDAIQAEQAFERQEKEALRKRKLAYLVVGMAMHKAAKAKELKRAQAEAGQNAIERSKKSATNSGSYISSEANDLARATTTALAQQHAAYARSIEAITEQLATAEAQRPVLESQMAVIQGKYQVFDTHLAEANAHVSLAMRANITKAQVIEAMKIRINYLNTQIGENDLSLSRLAASHSKTKIAEENKELLHVLNGLRTRRKILKGSINDDLPLSFEDRMAFIEGKISALHNQMLGQIVLISELGAITGREHEATAMIQEHQGLHTQLQNLMDRVAVLRKEKILFDQNFVETDSFEKAAYILSPGQRIVKDEYDGKHYLLRGTQRLDTMPESEKKKAHQDFQHAINNGATLQKLVSNNKTTEITAKQKQLDKMQGEIDLLQTQLTVVKKEKAALGKTPTNTPTPAFMLSQPSPKPVQSTEQIEELLEKIKRKPCAKDIEKLRKIAPQNKAFQTLLNDIQPGIPPGATTMNSLLRNMTLLGLSPYKPGISQLESPSEQPKKMTPFPIKPAGF